MNDELELEQLRTLLAARDRECDRLREGFQDLRSSVLAALILLPKNSNGKQLLEMALPKANRILNADREPRGGSAGVQRVVARRGYCPRHGERLDREPGWPCRWESIAGKETLRCEIKLRKNPCR